MTLREVAIFPIQDCFFKLQKTKFSSPVCLTYALPMHAGLPTIFLVGLPTVFLVGLPTIFMVGNNDWSKQLALRTINFKP
jgi:hypothetical protein